MNKIVVEPLRGQLYKRNETTLVKLSSSNMGTPTPSISGKASRSHDSFTFKMYKLGSVL